MTGILLAHPCSGDRAKDAFWLNNARMLYLNAHKTCSVIVAFSGHTYLFLDMFSAKS